MAARGKVGRLCGAFLVAVSMIAIAAGTAHAQENTLADLNERILDTPEDVELNLRYARLAEEQGVLRAALAAYERILINDPSNAAARRGYERVRRMIEPGYTVTRLEVGARWDSNALGLNEDAFVFLAPDEREATTYYGKLQIVDEREIFDRRWRSILNAAIEDTPDLEVLDYQYIGAQTGPIFYIAPHVAALPAFGGGAAWLGSDFYFSEANISLTIEGRTSNASYWARLRGGYREYDPDTNLFFDTVTEQGPYAELHGGWTKPHLVSERDTLLVEPFVRWSDIDGSVFSFSLFDELSPGKYLEYGVDVNYNYQLTDHIEVSVGALYRERDFGDSIRQDTYLSPQASLTFEGLLPCGCDLRLQYRQRDNDTNDSLSSYDAEQVSLALLARF